MGKGATGEDDSEAEMDCDTSGDESNCFSDDEDRIYTFGRPSRKTRLLDSDDEDNVSSQREKNSAKHVTGQRSPPPSLHEETCSMSMFGADTRQDPSDRDENSKMDGKEPVSLKLKGNHFLKDCVIRRPSIFADPEEASMGPLVFNESFENEESNSLTVPSSQRNKQDNLAMNGEKDWNTEHIAEKDPSIQIDKATEGRNGVSKSAALALSAPPDDSGVGVSLEEDTHTQLVEGEGERPEGGGDNSLEGSLMWEQSLPPAQPRKEHSLELFPALTGVGGRNSLGSNVEVSTHK